VRQPMDEIEVYLRWSQGCLLKVHINLGGVGCLEDNIKILCHIEPCTSMELLWNHITFAPHWVDTASSVSSISATVAALPNPSKRGHYTEPHIARESPRSPSIALVLRDSLYNPHKEGTFSQVHLQSHQDQSRTLSLY
jgi:hypothetical protein